MLQKFALKLNPFALTGIVRGKQQFTNLVYSTHGKRTVLRIPKKSQAVAACFPVVLKYDSWNVIPILDHRIFSGSLHFIKITASFKDCCIFSGLLPTIKIFTSLSGLYIQDNILNKILLHLIEIFASYRDRCILSRLLHLTSFPKLEMPLSKS